MFTLFEYGDHISVTDRTGLEIYLHSLWQNNKALWNDHMPATDDLSTREFQPFISFDGVRAKANNFVGFIYYGNEFFEIYPKVFRQMPDPNKELMHRHLFYWFSYCNKIKFPFNQSFLNNFDSDCFPELIIYLIANQINEIITTKPYSAYEEVEEALLMPRGKINFSRYARNIALGKGHYIECDYDSFIYDNKVNRVIKYCTRLLLSKAMAPETQRVLNGIINELDEVEDQVCSVNHLEQIRIPALFFEYEDIMHSCRMIIESQVYSYAEYEMKNWSLLFPMEYIFEDFISGFLKNHFDQEFEIESQKSELYLHQNPQTFNLQHDILLTNRKTKEKIIIDAKYKPRWGLSDTDKKRGVSQSDMYQMISYAYRRGTDKVILMYPNTSDNLAEDYMFTVQKSNENEHIKIKVVDIPFWSSTDYREVEARLLIKLGNVLLSGF